ncbi:MAG: AAA family ATPase [Candidatus Doudnabacteria bacterium RIFCSPLOWO2_02_FULL_49_13]|uniref:AAA family ATPase n=1 Tax=Candidatus Doudnabacteria bacterium RIFCSPHIGHO2_12_FULL_48_16 TaxID=1817838 RepID=A0A1F5PKX9_9BACT|nr:MAG: AAA family ATPase [Candidatus Doudnabacteria bacterium RIFCSPHIGHO2_02_FULL_49_24]OGE89080.1 MAG: AAA family ATPase [Candidatus Doudnabacteria bacterium RIFCSPHIGHO2_01_FULL_50_67]OGE90561.1 MAG: AAA family ATPase [Candidatus Doudnabacteria bacterium RIFCSPHIGHO2_12_FULL_48_16]OGE97598.1 MAG: AAA family ATPase [Candidatus Doudnabacteria bacterium RIFCSPLOWO2_01_FULL_49_40]OGF02953.1 MAG: AAA family ATPase [Candidatus Doudnabacteria bacterium RIFCSPLOWO2_02_FULL_49_13]
MEPLASKIRPKNLEEFIGQAHLVGLDRPLRIAIENKHLFSFIFWGPPGVGKTTLAKIYAKALNADLFELSAVSSGKDDVRQIVNPVRSKTPGTSADMFTYRTSNGVNANTAKPKVLFLDEIHRFNKAQQDYLLPFVEKGEITLIGATTENPSFEIIPALLSRCRVFVLHEFSAEEMSKIIDRTGVKLDKKSKEWLVNMANGDARQAITMLENTVNFYGKATVENLKNTLQSKFLRFDKKGEEHHNTISAFIKSMRASQPDAALYYLARMIESGEDPKFIARRMVVFASEDIGLAQPTALVVANDVFRAVETIGLPEAAVNLAHGVAYLALAPKNRDSYNAYYEALDDVKELGNLPIPMMIRNAPTKLMKDLGYHQGYELYPKEDLLPEQLKGKKYLKRKK